MIVGIVILVLIIGGVIAYNLYSMPTSSSSDAGGSAASSGTNIQEGNLEIKITGFAFSPSEIRIKSGSTITWTNEDSASHTVSSDSGKELDSQTLDKGQSYEHTFDQKGTYNYHCKFHSGMKGKIVVE